MAKRSSVFSYDSDFLASGWRELKRTAGDAEQWVETLLPADAAAPKTREPVDRKPLLFLAMGALISIFALATRLFALQVNNGNRNLGLANGNRIRQTITHAPRGLIYDHNHNLLVNNLAAYDLTITPNLLPVSPAKRVAIYTKVAGLLAMKVADVQAPITKAGLSSATPVLISSHVNRDQAMALDQALTDLPGVNLEVNPIRQYSDNSLAQFLGYVGRVSPEELTANSGYFATDYIGKTGLEQSYEKALKGQDGREQTEVDASGRSVKLLADVPAAAGRNLVLTIDEALQQKLASSLQKEADLAHSKKAAAVALDPKTGAVLAAVSLPNYDNNLFAAGISTKDYAKLLSDPAQPLFNKVISGAYPSGSTIKPFVASAALEERVVTPQTTVVDKGELDIPNPYNPAITYVFHGWEHTGLGVMNVYSALAMSSDIYFYTVAGGFGKFVGLGVGKLTSYYQKFGFGEKTGVDVPGETAGRVPTPAWKQQTQHQPWYTGDTYNISVGQGDILVSPLQLAEATASVANGGTLYEPYFVGQITDSNGKVVQTRKPVVMRSNFISASNLAIVRAGMRQAVQSGTACCVFDKQVPVQAAGKTGTAETDPGKRAPDAWFSSFAPYGDPRIVIVALIENSGEGAEFAVPAVRETMAWYFQQH